MGKPTEALHAYCQYPDDIEPECMYYYDDRTVVINDAFAKVKKMAKYGNSLAQDRVSSLRSLTNLAF